MLFNSPEFLLFLPIVFALYWFVVQRNLRAQNVLLVLASYVFYGWWDWRFLGLIALSTVVDYLVVLQIEGAQEKRAKQQWLSLSMVVNLGLLCYFKYSNFFIESWVDAWAAAGVNMQISSLKVILPVGISFYTFQTLSYSIDVYRGNLKPTRSLINFAAFVSFFPQLVAGPIERATRLLPQIENRRTFKYEEGVAGLRLILWGMFKKVVVADTCAIYANDIFANCTDYSGPTLMLGAVYFAFQIYGDFSGYSDIAIGTAKLFGIELMTNFKTPYFSRDIAEFWRRWHISLSTWFRDYLYIPLGGSRVGKWKSVRNVFVIFLVSGFWHGANWTFIAWGGIHACLFIPLLLRGTNRRFATKTIAKNRWLPNVRELLGMAWTFTMVCIAWVFFRAESVGEATAYLSKIGSIRDWLYPSQSLSFRAFAFLGAMVVGDWLMRNGRMPAWWQTSNMLPIRWGFASLGGWFILKNFASQADFIYFQF
ncbi:MAG TPA: membrane-bound O-acyltransferase family protein [Flavobacteriales bacterium]|nr:membrane-bound O-acyltransferase family protein [Flavobacteriales bacterium]